MTMELPQELALVEPTLADHLRHDDGFVIARVRRTHASAPPWRGSELVDIPHATLVHDLEVDRRDMRAQFLAALRAHAAAGRALDLFASVLANAFQVLYGGRGSTAHTAAFHRWAYALATGDDLPVVRGIALHALIGAELPGVDELFAGASAPEDVAERHRLLRASAADRARDQRPTTERADVIAFDAETGHVPADHPALLYWLADLVPHLHDADFDQVAPDFDRDPDTRKPYTLRAYHAGKRWTCRAVNHGDSYDVPSCIGLINAVLRDTPWRVAALAPADQAMCVIGATTL